MSCCGNRRAAQRANPPPATVRAQPRTTTQPRHAAPAGATQFEYSGPGTIVVVGPLTGTTYRFTGRGARSNVHAADAPSLVAVQGLKPIHSITQVPRTNRVTR